MSQNRGSPDFSCSLSEIDSENFLSVAMHDNMLHLQCSSN